MKKETLQSGLASFYGFIKLSKEQKMELLREQGVCLDFDRIQETITRFYFLQGFFVEETFNSKLNEVIDIMPYKQGYKIGQFLKQTASSINERPYYFQYCIN